MISDDLNSGVRGHYFTEDAFLCLREESPAFGDSRTEEIGCGGCCQHRGQRGIGKTCHRFLISMSTCGVACNRGPRPALQNSWKILSFHPRKFAHNSSIPAHLLMKLNDDPDIRVRTLAFKNTALKRDEAAPIVRVIRKSVSSELRCPSYRSSITPIANLNPACRGGALEASDAISRIQQTPGETKCSPIHISQCE